MEPQRRGRGSTLPATCTRACRGKGSQQPSCSAQANTGARTSKAVNNRLARALVHRMDHRELLTCGQQPYSVQMSTIRTSVLPFGRRSSTIAPNAFADARCPPPVSDISMSTRFLPSRLGRDASVEDGAPKRPADADAARSTTTTATLISEETAQNLPARGFWFVPAGVGAAAPHLRDRLRTRGPPCRPTHAPHAAPHTYDVVAPEVALGLCRDRSLTSG